MRRARQESNAMSDFIICPVCETSNDPGATNCEVCGERLAPLQPGEELAPEENVSAMLAEAAAAPEAAPEPAAEPAASGFDADDDDDYGALSAGTPDSTMADDEPAAAPDDGMMGIDPVGEPVSFYGDDAPDVLYSPTTGEAYPKGTAEYEEGFGPMGEQLVATPPSAEPEAAEAPQEEASFEGGFGDDEDEDYDLSPSTDPEDAQEAGFQAEPEPAHEDASFGGDEDDDLEAGFVPSGATAPAADVEQGEPASVEKPNPFRVSGPNPAVVLPKPGTYEKPASVTLYYQKQPVLTHDIETDETLIGRKDIRADIYPDIDLSQYDAESFVSRKHAYIYRQNKNYTLYAISNGGVQLNSDLLELGDRRQLSDGDVIVIAGFLAFKFSKGD